MAVSYLFSWILSNNTLMYPLLRLLRKAEFFAGAAIKNFHIVKSGFIAYFYPVEWLVSMKKYRSYNIAFYVDRPWKAC